VGACEILDADVEKIHATTARVPREGEETFRIPWELRSFAIGVAYYESDGFPWTDFQTALVAAIDDASEDKRPEHYYARWVEALEALLRQRGGLDLAELERRTQEILRTPRDDTHQHAHTGPLTVEHAHGHPYEHQHH
jgi:nitrile hydratase accessory protein